MRKGISLVALIITIIVLIVLTSAVVIKGMNTPENAQLAVFYNNITCVQDAVTLKILNNQLKYITEEVDINNYKWVGVIQGYDETLAQIQAPDFQNSTKEINETKVLQVSEDMASTLSIGEESLSKYYIDQKGVVYSEGFTVAGITYYNRTETTESLEQEPLEPIVNYVMLYDRGISNIVLEEFDALAMSKPVQRIQQEGDTYLEAVANPESYWGSWGGWYINDFDLSDYDGLYQIFTSNSAKLCILTTIDTVPADGTTAIGAIISPSDYTVNKETLLGLNLQNCKTPGHDLYFYLGGDAYNTGIYRLYDAFLTKNDNYEGWAQMCGITVNNLQELLSSQESINTLMNNESAVNYMLANCTGTLMLECLNNSMVVEEIKSSAYANMIFSNEHWGKFLNKLDITLD